MRHGRGAAGGGRPVRLLAGGCAAGKKIFVKLRKNNSKLKPGPLISAHSVTNFAALRSAVLSLISHHRNKINDVKSKIFLWLINEKGPWPSLSAGDAHLISSF